MEKPAQESTHRIPQQSTCDFITHHIMAKKVPKPKKWANLISGQVSLECGELSLTGTATVLNYVQRSAKFDRA